MELSPEKKAHHLLLAPSEYEYVLTLTFRDTNFSNLSKIRSLVKRD